MKDDAAISPERLWIQPAGIGGVKAPQRLSVSKIHLWLPMLLGMCGARYFRNSLSCAAAHPMTHGRGGSVDSCESPTTG
jgi:hypothetical protein